MSVNLANKRFGPDRQGRLEQKSRLGLVVPGLIDRAELSKNQARVCGARPDRQGMLDDVSRLS